MKTQASHSVSLPMYDLPEIRPMTRQWGEGIIRHIQAAGFTEPLTFTSAQPDDSVRTLWDQPNLLVTQCCGFDVVNSYAQRLTPLVTPHYQAEGCVNHHYSSVVIVPENSAFQTVQDLAGAVAVINETESQSGMNALFTLINPLANNGYFFKQVQVSGGHIKSLQAVQERRADVAALDCVTFALLKRYRPTSTEGIRVLTTSAAAPALPYVTSSAISSELQSVLRTALLSAFTDPALQAAREALLIGNAQAASAEHYQVILERFGFDRRLLVGV